jgi:hypothetical protein
VAADASILVNNEPVAHKRTVIVHISLPKELRMAQIYLWVGIRFMAFPGRRQFPAP